MGKSTGKGNTFQGTKPRGGIHVKRDLNETDLTIVMYGHHFDSHTNHKINPPNLRSNKVSKKVYKRFYKPINYGKFLSD